MQLARTKEWRESRGFTQRELAAEAGISEVTVARLETGHSSTPPTARKIADALGVAVADLLERPPVPLADSPPSEAAGRQEIKVAGPAYADEHGPEPTLEHDFAGAFWSFVADQRAAGFDDKAIHRYLRKEMAKLEAESPA